MELIFESERLRFRPLSMDDLDLSIALWTDPEVTRYTAERVYKEEELRADLPIATRRCAGGSIGVWCLIEKQSGEKLGTAILLPLPLDQADTDWELVRGESLPDADIEIGYILKRSAWGKGYATEACKRLLRFAFTQTPLDEIFATVDQGNTASRRVLEKSGLKSLGMIRAYGGHHPGFRITREEWLQQ